MHSTSVLRSWLRRLTVSSVNLQYRLARENLVIDSTKEGLFNDELDNLFFVMRLGCLELLLFFVSLQMRKIFNYGR
jgi:hypothetical protein